MLVFALGDGKIEIEYVFAKPGHDLKQVVRQHSNPPCFGRGFERVFCIKNFGVGVAWRVRCILEVGIPVAAVTWSAFDVINCLTICWWLGQPSNRGLLERTGMRA